MTFINYDLADKIEALVSEHLGMPTRMHMIVEYIDAEGVERTSIAFGRNQSLTSTAGVLQLATAVSNYELTAYAAEASAGD